MVNAQWLFENHLSHLAMEKYLLTRIDHIIRPSSLENAGEILSQTLKHPVSDIPIQKNHQGSSTERIALLLQEKEKEQSKESIEELNQQLFLCRFLLELYDAVLVSLIPREAWLVEAIYHQGIPISSIVNEPDCPYGYCDRSTIYRTRKRIIQKSDYFLQTYIPKEVSQCRLEKFMIELKLLQEKNIVS